MANTSPLAQYQHDLTTADFFADASQASAIEKLDALYYQLTRQNPLIRRLIFRHKPINGIYLWGDVGSGKTYLMDTFYHCLPEPLKQRTHFHAFMRDIHQQLKQLQGKRDPLQQVAKNVLAGGRVLCFDEFFVQDIADAMLLGRLLSVLFAQGMTIVATSNIPLANLYEHGLQRQRFLPTIALLQSRLEEINVDNQVDYRRAKPLQRAVFFSPLDEYSAKALQDAFVFHAQDATLHGCHLLINQRQLNVIASATGIVQIDFNELCQQPTGVQDYLQLAKLFHTLILSHIPVLSSQDETAATRFIHLIDILYEAQTHVFLSSAVPIEQIYQGNQKAFKRTLSRLQEMQSAAYIERAVARKYQDVAMGLT